MNIVLVMCFYDSFGKFNKSEKRNVTLLILKYYKYIKELLKKNHGVKMDFVLVGSEKEASKQTVIDSGLSSDYYYEFSQENYNSHRKIIQDKYEYGYRVALQKYKNTLDLLLTNGSSDFIPTKFFEGLIKNELLNTNNQPYFYGISSLKFKNSFIFYMYDNINNCYFVSDNTRKDRPNETVCRGINFVGGIYGFNKQLLNNINYKISLPDGNEYVLESEMISKKAVPKSLCNWFINYKISSQDVTSMAYVQRVLNIVKYNGECDEINNFVSLLKKLKLSEE
jgi:hypothetical protein